MTSLHKRAISSVKWTTFQTTASALLGPIILTIKARFLSPEEFGYLSIVLIAIGLIKLLESFGMNQAIIQRNKISIKESSTIFYFNIFLSCFWAVILYFSAPFIAIFFSLPELKNHLPVVGLIILLHGPSLMFRAFLQKQLFFKHLSLIEISQNLIVAISTVFFLLLGFGVIGIIYSYILGALFGCVSIPIIAFRYKVTSISGYFSPAKLIPFLRFGLFVSGKQMMTYAMSRMDEILIGYFLTPEILGVYHFGKHMLEKIRGLITNSFAKVLFPVLSELKDNRKKLTWVYHKISHYIGFGAFPLFTGIAITAHLFVPIFFGEKWNDSVIVFQIFSIAIIFSVLTANVSSSLLYAINKPDLVFYIDLIINMIYFISLLMFIDRGILAVLITYFSFRLFKAFTLQLYVNRQLAEGFINYLQQLSIPALSSIVMVFIVLLFQKISNEFTTPISQFAGSMIFGAIAYSIMSWFFARNTLLNFKLAITQGDIKL